MSPLESCALRFQALVTWEFPAGWKVLNMEMQTKPWAPAPWIFLPTSL